MSLKLLSILKIIFGGQKGIYVTLISTPNTPTQGKIMIVMNLTEITSNIISKINSLT